MSGKLKNSKETRDYIHTCVYIQRVICNPKISKKSCCVKDIQQGKASVFDNRTYMYLA